MSIDSPSPHFHVEDEFVPVEGRSVVVQIAEGEWRPAQIVKVWSADVNSPRCVNLVVFADGSNDDRRRSPHLGGAPGQLVCWMTSVTYGNAVRQYLPRKPWA